MVTFKQRHERNGKRLKSLVERFQRVFPTDGIAEEDREKIDDLVAPEAPPCKTHTLTNLTQNTMLTKIPNDQRDLAKPGRGRGADSAEVWMITAPSAILVICASLRESVLFFLLKEAHFIPPRYGLAARCASRGLFKRE